MIRALRPAKLTAGRVDEVVLSRPRIGINGLAAPGVSAEPPYRNMLQAQMSAKFTAIATLLSRPVEEASYFRDCYADPDVDRIARRTRLAISSEERPSVEVKLRNGQQLVMTIDQVPDMGWAQQHVEDRFESFAAPYLRDKVRVVRKAISRLHEARDIQGLMALVR